MISLDFNLESGIIKGPQFRYIQAIFGPGLVLNFESKLIVLFTYQIGKDRITIYKIKEACEFTICNSEWDFQTTNLSAIKKIYEYFEERNGKTRKSKIKLKERRNMKTIFKFCWAVVVVPIAFIIVMIVFIFGHVLSEEYEEKTFMTECDLCGETLYSYGEQKKVEGKKYFYFFCESCNNETLLGDF